MSWRAIILMPAIGLAACNDAPAEPETVDEFAARVGTATSAAPAEQAATPGQAVVTSAVEGAPAPQTNVLAPEKLGNIADVDLGPRAGGCTFATGSTEMLIAAAPEDRSIPGKAVVRLGGQLLVLDAPPGGYNLIKSGTGFQGEGFAVSVARNDSGADSDAARMTVTDDNGQQKIFDGRWVCS
ncbi:hypothetical protein ACRAQ7_12365 [Erythrobacter sp. W53]|uniref:hypothetical protein n=1 Tax=Erythrobacter sp. W53 TaxID=3425947 RepID=UPI003D76762E